MANIKYKVVAYVCFIFFKFEDEVPKVFLGTIGFSLHMDGRYTFYMDDFAIPCINISSWYGTMMEWQ